MKHTLLLILFIALLSTTRAQYVTIPDAAFAQYLSTNFPQCMNGNQLDTTCPEIINSTFVECNSLTIASLEGLIYFKNLETLRCHSNRLTTLPALPPRLKYIDCDYNLITSLAAIPDSALMFHCAHNQLTSLPALPDSLNYLDCSYNLLTALPALPDGINQLKADSNLLTTVPALPTSLIDLNVSNNQLTALPVLPAIMEYLIADKNQLSSLQVLPVTLKGLSCNGNQLSVIPTLPAPLEYLECSDNLLTALPALPAGLDRLKCDFNDIASLPPLPPLLTLLYCAGNNLTALPPLPSKLNTLMCAYSYITALPPLPDSLVLLYCSGNPLATLPALPTTLLQLSADHCQLTGTLPAISGRNLSVDVSFNQLTGITSFPTSVFDFRCNNNPGLMCLPQMDTVLNLYIDATGITCLPNYPKLWNGCNGTNCDLPLCDQFNSNGCPLYWNIGGHAYNDANNDCVNDAPTETGVTNVPVNVYSDGSLVQRITTGAGGSYSFDGHAPATYEIKADTTGLPLLITCPLNGGYADTLTISDSLRNNRDFAFVCRPGFDVGVWSTVGEAHPARTTAIRIFAGDVANFYNASCATGVTGTVSVTVSGPVRVDSAMHGNTAAQVTGNTLVWNAIDFGMMGAQYFTVYIVADTFASVGQPVCVHTTIITGVGDYNAANNTGMFCFNVTGSFDPNDKQVYPQGNLDTAQEWLTYTVRFQNTGTAPAFNIHVDDTLDANLDATTFKLLSYSHQPQVYQKERAVRFYFPNINLPDSNTNEPASHGYVQYKVKLKPNLPIGAIVSNTAFIYFDFNAPVITNTTTNSYGLHIGILETSGLQTLLQVYPNPASDRLYIKSDALVNEITIYSITGALAGQYNNLSANSIDISVLPAGVYIAEVKANGTTARCRWVKL